MFNFLLLCATVLLTACAGRSVPPPSSPPPAASEAEPQPAGAAKAQAETKEHDDLKVEVAAIDAALTDLRKRLEVARDDVKADVKQQLASLQKREDDVKAQLKETGARVDAEAEKARRDIHRAIMELQIDTMQLTDRLPR